MVDTLSSRATQSRHPAPGALLELLKPITWFAPMWAFMCGVVSSGVPILDAWPMLILGALLAGPLVCGTSQAVNDWFDRHVDAINEPNRPIPSGRVPGRWGLYVGIVWSAVSLAVATLLGVWVVAAVCVGLVLAWLYSAPPIRLKGNGWFGCLAVGLCYEGLPWFTGTAAMIGGLPDTPVLLLAGLYSLGAFGIMTLNDFKAVEGDQALGIRSLPVQLGVRPAAWLACVVMALPQVAVSLLLFSWGAALAGAMVAALLAVQIVLMVRLLEDPRAYASWYNATGTTLYVLGMLAGAVALRGL
ncbi:MULTISPECIES: chlorophyll synthase ChlG [Thalassobaculum]|uniref:Chlorophyll synthase n=1 Tax=Thalassobaculum litoreum DSM 18839 TaxID=1123362 RepID=A0A8G2BFK4_9PROT|nr:MULTISPECIES: chlorophyll synthase ChlG [Thalassobaculum]SDF26326.1 chlorophyll synthase [Thalassobaculum litoreum DSM 18839]